MRTTTTSTTPDLMAIDLAECRITSDTAHCVLCQWAQPSVASSRSSTVFQGPVRAGPRTSSAL